MHVQEHQQSSEQQQQPLPQPHSQPNEQLSFVAPFGVIDEEGKRRFPHYHSAGATLIKERFMRLTPDVPNALGAAWSEEAIGTPEFSLEMKFRASGSSETTQGESFSMFITDRDGDLHGYGDAFTGIGVVVDHSPHPGAENHYDVSIVINDGRHALGEGALAAAPGCNAEMRYWEKRDDFTVLSASRMRLRYTASNTLTLELDPRNTGLWRNCVTLEHTALPRNWAVNSKIALIAANGAQGNNHDVLSLKVFNSADAAWELEHYAGSVESKSDVLAHHLEHQLFTVKSELERALRLLAASEHGAAARISALEERLGAFTAHAMETRMGSLELMLFRTVSQGVQDRLDSVHESVETEMMLRLKKLSAEESSRATSPFYVLAIFVLTLSAGSYAKLAAANSKSRKYLL